MCVRALPAVLLAAVLAGGCESGRGGSLTGPSETPASAVIELRFDQVAMHGPLELEWLKLDDSRCPKGVTCVWEGQAAVALEVAREGEAALSVELVLRAGSDPRPVDAAGHRFVLLAVEPYPEDGVTPERSERLARIRVSSLG